MDSTKEYVRVEEHISTRQQEHDVLFTRGVLSFLGLAPKNIMLKCGPYRFVSVLQVANLQRIQFITPDSGLLTDALEKYNYKVSIRFVFVDSNHKPLNVPGVFIKMIPYPPNKKYQLAEIQLDNPLPEEYCDMIESIIEINRMARSRTEPRIMFTKNDTDCFGLNAAASFIKIGLQTARCYLRDLSPSGAGIILMGDKLFEKDQVLRLLLHLNDQFYPVELDAYVMRSSWYDKKLHLIEVVLFFIQESIPVSYHAFLDHVLRSIDEEKRSPLVV